MDRKLQKMEKKLAAAQGLQVNGATAIVQQRKASHARPHPLILRLLLA
jgi:hypothetical protein